MIRVKCGAQSLPISLDLINPNHVIVFDDKEVSVREPHCQIIVLLSHSAQSKVDIERPAANMDYRGKQRTFFIVNRGRLMDTWTERPCIDHRLKIKSLDVFKSSLSIQINLTNKAPYILNKWKWLSSWKEKKNSLLPHITSFSHSTSSVFWLYSH